MFFQPGTGVKVKICGITDLSTALAAVNAGADALGFVFAPRSRRRIEPAAARDIISALPSSIDTVGVFTGTPPEEICRIAAYCNLDIIQLQGGDTLPAGLPVIQCLRVGDKGVVEGNFLPGAAALLLDTYHPEMDGGTGMTFNWQIAAGITTNLPLILAGGLNSANVARAIKTVRPAAVDVSSGVETGGKKDSKKIKAFIQTVKEVKIC